MGKMMNVGGYKHRILRVNLSERNFSEENLSNELIHDYIGGRGFGIKFLYDDLRPGINPLGEEGELIFTAGPLAGTNAQSCSRWLVFFKSPLTGTYFRCSGGGYWASELKSSGFDAIVIKGVSDKPVYLWIKDGRYELRDADYLWGLDCDDTHSLIREELNDPRIRIACIGPAPGHVFEEKPMLDEYYKARGWDLKTGIPTANKLNELGLSLTTNNKSNRS